jgi:WD40 repeat protein
MSPEVNPLNSKKGSMDVPPSAGNADAQRSKPPRRFGRCLLVSFLACLLLVSSAVLVFRLEGWDSSTLQDLPLASAFAKNTRTPSPAPTSLIPSITPFPTPRLAPIDEDNADSLYPYNRLGKGSLLHIGFSPDGNDFIAMTKSGIDIYRMGNLKEDPYLSIDHRSYLRRYYASAEAATSSPDGSIFVIGSGTVVTLWGKTDTETPSFEYDGSETLGKNEYYYGTTSVAISPNGELLAQGGGDNVIRIWTIPQNSQAQQGALLGKLTLGYQQYRPSKEWITCLSFSPDGNLLAAGSSLGQISLWRMSDGSLAGTIPGHSQAVNSLAFSPDGSLLASGSWDGTVRLWGGQDGSSRMTLSANTGGISSVVFSPDGRFLAAGSYDHAAYLWQVDPGSLVEILQGHTKAVTQLAFSPDGRTLATGSVDTTVKFWNIADGSITAELNGFLTDVQSLDFSPDDKVLAAGLGNGDIHLFQMADGSTAAILRGHSASVNSVAFSPDGMHLASGSSDSSVRIWNPSDGKSENILLGHLDSVRSVTYSPDGVLLASGSNDGTVRIWNAEDGTLAKSLLGRGEIRSVAFSPDGRLLAAGGSDANIILWNVADGSLAQTLTVGETWGIYSLAFSPDGKGLLIGCQSKIFMLRLADGQMVWTFEDNSVEAVSVGFLPGGKVVFCGDALNGSSCLIHASDGKPVLKYFMSSELNTTRKASHSGVFLAGGTELGFIEIFAVY